jgi:hypothetical protein
MIMMDSAIETGQPLVTSVEMMSKTAALKTLGCPATRLANDESRINATIVIHKTYLGR